MKRQRMESENGAKRYHGASVRGCTLVMVGQARRDMKATRDLEQEREELLRQIAAALSPEVRVALEAANHLPQEAKLILPTNEVGAEYADAR